MKRILSVLGAVSLILSMSLPASAAPGPISVYLDGSKISFPAGAPYTSQGTTLVPFRTIFEKLGLQVTWNAKTQTVTGSKEDLTLQLTLGSNRASINGVIQKLSVPPATVKGTTYVPLRFVGEAADAKVDWNEGSGYITIQTAKSTAVEQEKIRKLLVQVLSCLDKGDYNGLKPYLSADSPFQDSEKELNEWSQNNSQISKITDFEFVSLNQRTGEAFVETVEDTHRTGGLYMPDMLNQMMYTVVKEDGLWKLQDFEIKEITYKLPADALTKTVNVPSTEDSKINEVINLYNKYLSDKNLDGILALSDPSIITDEFKANLQSVFASRKMWEGDVKISNVRTIYYSESEAAVYFEENYLNPDTKSNLILGNVFVLHKSTEGKWLINAGYRVSKKFKGEEN
ncbi:copper amine oxidase N-terminal domain-containing protein [Paenibacillus tuaregi]|uniref:copper amine oxidase N-terminal domain-containing protein n=1 Tax=Paenibacillus tuaregi TaxID=1816681 RepID=UPI000837D2CB|nr:copper amine oxidase N-terminal domain-containing protein [Paenibacillus tuaregi]